MSATLDGVVANNNLSSERRDRNCKEKGPSKGLVSRILQKLRARDDSPVYINLLKESFIPGSLCEKIVKCLEDEKVLYASVSHYHPDC